MFVDSSHPPISNNLQNYSSESGAHLWGGATKSSLYLPDKIHSTITILVLVHGFYKSAGGVVRVVDQHTEYFLFKKGVRQGCLISPLLFNVVGENIMRTVRSKLPDAGLKIDGMNNSNIRYADDTTLLEDDKRKLEELAEAVKTESLDFGLKINEAKTNVITLMSPIMSNCVMSRLKPSTSLSALVLCWIWKPKHPTKSN